MKKVLLLLFSICLFKYHSSQIKLSPENFGFRHLQTNYEGDRVDILIKSKIGEELKKKPLFFFCQGSLPVPLILVDAKGGFGTFPFTPDSLLNDFHLIIVGKPFIPVIADTDSLDKDYTWYEHERGHYPAEYIKKNNLDYYLNRNLTVIRFLRKQTWVSMEKLVVAGHSEGSYIAAKMASASKEITHLIYSGGNPLGRMLTIITRARQDETNSQQYAEQGFDEWSRIVQHPEQTESTTGDPNNTTYSFSISLMEDFKKIKKPVLVTYGTRDAGAAPFNDYLRLEMIRHHKTNYSFVAYPGKEHNFFSMKSNGEINYDDYNWDNVVTGWLRWFKNN